MEDNLADNKCPICQHINSKVGGCEECGANIPEISDAQKAKYQNQQEIQTQKQKVKSIRESKKSQVNIVLLGHVDAGKSTLAGHLIYKLGGIDQKQLQQYQLMSSQLGKASFKYAWVVDKLNAQRQRGITIDCSSINFETSNYRFEMISTPGLRDFIKNTITGINKADCAIMVIGASKYEFEQGFNQNGQTRQHLLLAYVFGVKSLIICINKMDSVDYKQERFKQIKQQMNPALKKIGYNPNNVSFIPISAYFGQNLVESSKKMPWYSGPCLLEALDSLEQPKRFIDKPLRVPIQDIYKIPGIGTILIGRVFSGKIKKGDEVMIGPTGLKGVIKQIMINKDEEIEEAEAGQNIGINMGSIPFKQFRRGQVVGSADEKYSPKEAISFIAKLIIFNHPGVIKVGYTPVVDCHTAHVACKFNKFIQKIDKFNGKLIEQNPTQLRNGDCALVQMIPCKLMSVQIFNEYPLLGRFAIRDMKQTVAVGTIQNIIYPTSKQR